MYFIYVFIDTFFNWRLKGKDHKKLLVYKLQYLLTIIRKPFIVNNDHRADKRSLKLRTKRRLDSLLAESPWTEQANMRAHAGQIRGLVSNTHDLPSSLTNRHFLLKRCAAYLVVDIYTVGPLILPVEIIQPMLILLNYRSKHLKRRWYIYTFQVNPLTHCDALSSTTFYSTYYFLCNVYWYSLWLN